MNRREFIIGSVGSAAAASLFVTRLSGAVDRPNGPEASPLRELSGFRPGEVHTARHRTSYLETGPKSGPLMIFLHGFPELGIIWTAQMAYFAQRGWRCVAPDMRGYGGSSAPTEVAAYTVREISTDMVEMHDALGGKPAIWVGHDWGSPIAWAMASNHPERCHGVISLSVPYSARGHALPYLIPLIDRQLYPQERYPVGQWDYWLYYRETFTLAQRDFETNPAGAIAALYRSGTPQDVQKPATSATLREKDGWFGPAHQAPAVALDRRVLSQTDLDMFVTVFTKTGFRSALAWYLNDAANIDFAGEAKNFGQLHLPVLFISAEYDPVDLTVGSKLAHPMRLDCSNLTEAQVPSGHFLMLEKKREVSKIMSDWLDNLSGSSGEVSQARQQLGK